MTYLGRPILTWFLIEPISLWVSCPPPPPPPPPFKEAAYITLARPIIMEYTAPIWDPHLSKDTHMLDNIQRRATRFTKGDLRTSASVTKILQELGMKDLKDRHRDIRLALLFKVVQGRVGVSPEDIGLEPADGRTRANHKHKFRTRGERTNSYNYSYASKTICIGIKLPASIVKVDSPQAFKAGLMTITPAAPTMPWSSTHAICTIHQWVVCRSESNIISHTNFWLLVTISYRLLSNAEWTSDRQPCRVAVN